MHMVVKSKASLSESHEEEEEEEEEEDDDDDDEVWFSVIESLFLQSIFNSFFFFFSVSLEAYASSAVAIEWRDLAIAKTSFVMTESEHDTQQAHVVVCYLYLIG